MYRKYLVFMVLFYIFSLVEASENYIILTQEKNSESLKQQKFKYQQMIDSTAFTEVSFSKINLQPSTEELYGVYLLKVGPFESNDDLALIYLMLKEFFPKSFILEENTSRLSQKSKAKTVEKKVYITKEVIVEKEDKVMWIALFGLAIIGILFMFLSSDKIKRLKNEHEKIKSKHEKLEQKQHEVLSSMGENIHTIAKETMNHTSKLAEKVKATSLEPDMKKVIYNENELLDVTSDLIKFLRLKSKKVVIQNQVFNFNNVLNEIAGMLHHIYKQNDTELIFDIHKDVPRFMLADSLHLGQILINILEYFIQNSPTKEIKLEVTSYSNLKEGLQLQFQIVSNIIIKNKETFFESYYDEKSRRYVGLGLFVAKELTALMNGKIVVDKLENGHNSLVFTIPIEEKNREKRKYHLPHRNLVAKKMLIVDSTGVSALATEKLFQYFKAETTVLPIENFLEHMPNFANYDIVALSEKLFNFKVTESLKQIKKVQALKVISLDNLFSSSELLVNSVVDISLKKPLNQEYVFDTLIELYQEKIVDIEDGKETYEDQEKYVLPVYKETFKDVLNVSLESFQKFQGAHVLIVEDNVINQKVVLSVLSKSGMKLSVVNNGEEAVHFMRNNPEDVDFIFMDINMPVMDGYRATELIRNDARFDKVAIVSLTALVSEHEIEKMFDCGMNGYLPKPVRIEKLYSALDMFLTQNSTSNELKSIIEKPILSYDGLNIADGLEHMKGNIIFYKEVLKEFLDAYEGSDILFEKLVNEQRFLQVKMLCLDMKGLTETIGAKEMHTVINEIHQHMIYKKPEVLHSYVPRYRTEFKKLVHAIKMYLDT